MKTVDEILEVWLDFTDSDRLDYPLSLIFAPDVQLHFNGELVLSDLLSYQNLLRECKRRYPDWATEIIQAFGDTGLQCVVWHSVGGHDLPPGQRMDVHGVSMIETEDDQIVKVRIFFETGESAGLFHSAMGIRAV